MQKPSPRKTRLTPYRNPMLKLQSARIAEDFLVINSIKCSITLSSHKWIPRPRITGYQKSLLQSTKVIGYSFLTTRPKMRQTLKPSVTVTASGGEPYPSP